MYDETNCESTNILKLFEEKELVKICAPMVRYSKLQFRTLLRQYGCDLCYTPMILADSFCLSDKARRNEFTTNLIDTPLVVQFAANRVQDFVGASYMVSPYCNGVDLNCGCPQRWAKQMSVGCAMLDKPELIADLISQCRNQICKPFTISVKLRILKDERRTIELCRRLERAGVSFLSVHGRVSSQHTGQVNVNMLKLIVENVQCPIVANGGVNNLNDCIRLQEETKCNGVMVANGLLTNPTLFTNSDCTTEECIQNWLNICYNSTLNVDSYNYGVRNFSDNDPIIIPERPANLTFQCFHHHLVFMLEKKLPRIKKRIFNNLQSFKDVLEFLYEYYGVKPQLFSLDTFENQRGLDLSYENRDEFYKKLKCNEENYSQNNKGNNLYDPDKNDGKFFESKVSDSIADGEDYYLDNMFS